MDELLPVLVTQLASDADLGLLRHAARKRAVVFVPLAEAPMDASPHVLETYVTGTDDATLFVVEPQGPPDDRGFPLRVRPYSDFEETPPSSESMPSPPAALKTTQSEMPHMTKRHTEDLSPASIAPPKPRSEQLLGASLGGGKFVIEKLLGVGGVGEVYRAMHRELRKPVAIKVLHDSFQADVDFCTRFYAEALAASRLDHPNIARVFDFGQEPNGLLYIAMELLDGQNLQSVIDKEGKQPQPRAIEIMMQVCAALSHAHDHGIVHRDVKPDNIVLVSRRDDDGKVKETVKVCDFGIAQHTAQQQAVGPGAKAAPIAGTPHYMSPEQIQGQTLDGRSDVYACGVVLFELVTGRVPFDAPQPHQILLKHLREAPPDPWALNNQISTRLSRLITRAMSKDPRQRQQSVRDLRNELKEVLHPSEPPDVGPASVRRRTSGAISAPPPGFTSMAGMLDELHSINQPNLAKPGAAEAQRVAEKLTREFATAAAKDLPERSKALERALRELAQLGDAVTLLRAMTTLQKLAGLEQPGTLSREQLAARVVTSLRDPALLGEIATTALSGQGEQAQAAAQLLPKCGPAAANALYNARLVAPSARATRDRFVALMQALGPNAWPVLRAALEKYANMRPAGDELSEDLLRAIPATVLDEGAGNLVAQFVKTGRGNTCMLAIIALSRLWGPRARPLVAAALDVEEDAVRRVALSCLRQLSGIDVHVVGRIGKFLSGEGAESDELREEAATCLAETMPVATSQAIEVLRKTVTTETPIGDRAVVAAARALVKLSARDAQLVAARAKASEGALRAGLLLVVPSALR